MSAYPTIMYLLMVFITGVVLIFFVELHIGFLQPLQSDFTGETDLDNYADLFMSALIPFFALIAETLWYVKEIQNRRALVQ